MEDYSPSFNDDLGNPHFNESHQITAVRELPPQEYKDSPEYPDEEKADKPSKKDNKIQATFKKYWWLVALLGALAGGVAIVMSLGKCP